MNVYLDSSVALRRLRLEAAPISHWGEWEHGYASVLLRLEVLRTIDRMRLQGVLTDDQMAELITKAHAIFDAIDFVPLSTPILSRAEQSFRTALGTVDALHLSTGLWLREAGDITLTFLTHDGELALAAKSVNFQVEGT
ncbi:MAG: PIN domain-containing protein [Chthoniobacterales bacterium]|nr:PIN domain-containing protein [Chthoniobacterales bacterium]